MDSQADNVPFQGDGRQNPRRGPKFLQRLPLGPKNHIVAALGEFVGTFMFLLFAFGGANAVNTAPAQGQPADLSADPARLLFISLAFGISLAVNAWVFYRISGGLFNPAVSIALLAVGAISAVRCVVVIISQLLGGIAAAALVSGLQTGELYVSTTLNNKTSITQGFFIELFLTAQLVFTILMLAVEKHRSTPVAPIGIGLSLFITQMMGVYYTGGSLNPARSFGPSVVTGGFPGYHWIYHLGPILGGLLAAGFYKLIKALGYETANPGQDDVRDASLAHPYTNNHLGKGHDTSPTRHGAPISRGSTAVGAYGEGPSMEAGRH
ncbi:aquaporin-like protein [Poronia punctata]|nr:aquaporin-like protein [Poronia punctata]